MDTSERQTETCPSHGAYESVLLSAKLKNRSKCPRCTQDHSEHAEALLVQEELDRAAARILARLEAIGVPSRFHDATFDGFIAKDEQQRRALDWAKGQVKNFAAIRKAGTSTLLLGLPGTGKTHLACAVAIAIAEQGFVTRYSTVMRMIRRIKDSWRRESEESETAAIAFFAKPDLLVLDEVGVQQGSQFESNLLFDILNDRYERTHPTIIVSNLSIAEVSVALGERLIDRLREGGGKMISFEWPSHRRAT